MTSQTILNVDMKYRFSIIIACFNVQDYVREAFSSIEKQTFDFKQIQVIFVDDGSTDNTYRIIQEFAEKHPNNVIALHKENGGVSSARNMGLDYADGEIINFLDGDDKLSANALQLVSDFFANNNENVDVVSIPLVFFEAQNGQHQLNYKYNKGSRVIDLDTEWDAIQLSASSSFIKNTSFDIIRFDTEMKYAEDAKVILQLLARKNKLGVIKEATYYYRKRSDEDSAIDTGKARSEWYYDSLLKFQKETSDIIISKYGFLPKFVQYAFMYDLQWRISLEKFGTDEIANNDKEAFHQLLINILRLVDPDIIISQKSIDNNLKLYLLSLKFGCASAVITKNHSEYLGIGNTPFFSLATYPVYLDLYTAENDHITIEGWFPHFAVFDPLHLDKLICQVNGEAITVKYKDYEDVKVLEYPAYSKKRFYIELPLPKKDDICVEFGFSVSEGTCLTKNITCNKFFPISNVWNSYAFIGDRIVELHNNQWLMIKKKQRFDILKKELRFLASLYRLNNKNAKNAILVRGMCAVYRKLKLGHQLWILSDRINMANDNGEALFKYLQEHPQKDVKTYFQISKGSKDFARMKKMGNVLEHGTRKTQIVNMCADYIISSQADEWVFDPVYNRQYYQDILYNRRFIFLQHGIIGTNLSKWLNKYNQNIFGIITSCKKEKQSLLNTPSYYFNDSQIWMTGLARHDYLYHDEKNIITFMPTWRSYLVGSLDRKTGTRPIKPGFEHSNFFRFYNTLLNDPRLLQALKERNYRIQVLLHPMLLNAAHLFDSSERVSFFDEPQEYKKLFADSKLLVSDYSSTIFDFAYLRKPVIYCQFDKAEIFKKQGIYTEGYFDYENDGFGEVEYTIDDVVDRLIEYLDGDCRIKDKYKERIDSFFAFNDKENCSRIINRILQNDPLY